MHSSGKEDSDIDKLHKSVKGEARIEALSFRNLPAILSSPALFEGFTADERQPWTNYENNGKEYFTVAAVVPSE